MEQRENCFETVAEVVYDYMKIITINSVKSETAKNENESSANQLNGEWISILSSKIEDFESIEQTKRSTYKTFVRLKQKELEKARSFHT